MPSIIQVLTRTSAAARLVPFFICVVVYFAVTSQGAGGAGVAGVIAVKCAPILCLHCLALLNWADERNSKEARAYGRQVALALALSGAGDALLALPALRAGMAAFAAAHVVYARAFGLRNDNWLLGAALAAATLLYCRWLSPPAALARLVPAYGAALAGAAWRAAARGGAAAPGMALFVLSDAVLAYSMFGPPPPDSQQLLQVVVMSTYYLGQMGIALSTMEYTHTEPNARTHTD